VQGCQFFSLHELELVYVVYKVLEACVEVGLSRQEHYVLKVGVVYVGIDSEKSFEYYLYYAQEIAGEGNAHLTREHLFVVQL
jgi:hypothetical protein